MRSSLITFGLLAVLCYVSVSGQNAAQFVNDMNTLNYALALERFEDYYYQQLFMNFPNAAALNVTAKQYEYIKQAGSAESAHANALKSIITTSGWVDAGVCVYNLSNGPAGVLNSSNPAAWLSTLAAIENLGTYAYTYATRYLTSATFLQYAATVATVEARHAAALDVISNSTTTVPGNPVRFTYNPELPVSQVTNSSNAGAFFVSCTANTGTIYNGSSISLNVLDHFAGKPYEPLLNTNAKLNRVAPSGATNVEASSPNVSDAAFGLETLALQYALTAEKLEAAFYTQALAAITQPTFVDYVVKTGTNGNFNNNTDTAIALYNFFKDILAHENMHVAALEAVLNGRGISPVPACVYNFTSLYNSSDVGSFLTASKTLENTGVQAYTGAITLLSGQSLIATAASIALVEARHASFLQYLTNEIGLLPGPTGTDQNNDKTAAPSTVVAQIAGLFTSCPNITTADKNNGLYSSLTLLSKITPAINSQGTKGGYNDGGEFTFSGKTSTSSSNTNSNSNTNSRSSPATTVVASVFLVVAVIASLL